MLVPLCLPRKASHTTTYAGKTEVRLSYCSCEDGLTFKVCCAVQRDSSCSNESNLVPLGNRDSPTCPDTFGDLFFYSGKPQTQELPGLTGSLSPASAGAAQARLCLMHGLNTRPSAGNNQKIPCPHTPSERDRYPAGSLFCLPLSVLRVQLYASIYPPGQYFSFWDFLHQCGQNLPGSPWLFLEGTAMPAEEYFACKVSSLQKRALCHCTACVSMSWSISPL